MIRDPPVNLSSYKLELSRPADNHYLLSRRNFLLPFLSVAQSPAGSINYGPPIMTSPSTAGFLPPINLGSGM
jgi:hypothetical protein